MSKKIMRLIAAVVAAGMITALAAGCNRDSDSLYVPPEYVYVSEIIELPDEFGNISNFIYLGDKLYFVVTSDIGGDEGDERDSYSYSYASDIYSMNPDGTGITKLDGYAPPIKAPDDASGGVAIQSMIADGDGNFWVLERWELYGYDLPPDFDPEVNSQWEYYVSYGTGTNVRKLDSSGNEMLSVDVDSIKGSQEFFYIYSINVDSLGNIYMSSENYEKGGMAIHVLDGNGNLLFKLETESWFDRLIRLSDGSIAFTGDSVDESGNYVRMLKTIDFGARAFGEPIAYPNVGYDIMPGSGKYDVLIGDSNNLYGFTVGQEEAEKLVNWLDSDIVNINIQNITMISEEHIICTNSIWDNETYEVSYELISLDKTPYSQLPQKTALTLATFGMWSLRDAIVKFNRTNPDYRVNVIDYSEFNTEDDYTAGLTRLSTELISGKLPDILDVTSLQYKEYIARGLLADLYPFIDADPSINRSDLVQGALKAAEVGGALYQAFPSFTVNTIVGNPAVLGADAGWTMDEFTAVLDANPNADIPGGQWLNKNSFLQASISFGIDNYIDWETGTVHFDTPDFIHLLEYTNRFPDEPDWDNMDWENYEYVSDEEAIATGRQIMSQMTLYDFWNFQYNKAMYGGEIVFKGFPNVNRTGNSLSADSSLSIIEKSKNKDGAWAFVRTLFDMDWQLTSYNWGMPTNQGAFEKKVQDAMAQDYESEDTGGGPRPLRAMGDLGIAPQVKNLTDADVAQIKALIDSASSMAGWNMDPIMWNIISEGVADYYSGAASAQDVARVIQSRVSILVSERS